MKNKKVYLSGPISSCPEDGLTWRNEITPYLIEMGFKILDPCQKHIENGNSLKEIEESKNKFKEMSIDKQWGNIKKMFSPIMDIDLKMTKDCDYFILNYDPMIPMVGSIHELM